jgi:hypothetical protein
MQGLEVWGERAVLRVLPDGHLAVAPKADGASQRGFCLQSGRLELGENPPLSGLWFYAMPCVHEGLSVQREGNAAALCSRAIGEWPASIDDDELQTYPHLHFLEERKTGMPWRYERWYTLADPYLVFDSEQYFERPCRRERGKDWERFVVQLRQVLDLRATPEGPTSGATHLVHASDARE